MSKEFVEKDSKVGYVVTIIILVLIILGLSGFIVYEHCFKSQDKCNAPVEEVENDNNKEKNDTVTKAKFNATDAEVLDKIKAYNGGFYEYYLAGTKNEITDKEKLYFAFLRVLNRGKDITSKNISEALVEYFGKNHGVEIGDIYCAVDDTVFYKHDEENDIYVRSGTHGHGGGLNLVSYTKFVSSELNGDQLTVKAHVAYAKMCSDTCGPATYLYGSYNDMINKTNAVYGNDQDDIMEYTDNMYNSIKDKLPVTTYTFKVEDDGNYYLEKVSINK